MSTHDLNLPSYQLTANRHFKMVILVVFRMAYSVTCFFDVLSAESDVEGRIEEIRGAMLDSISVCLDEPKTRPPLRDLVIEAPCVQTLWCLRINLMSLLSSHFGEATAKKRMSAITEKFRGVVPAHEFSQSKRFLALNKR